MRKGISFILLLLVLLAGHSQDLVILHTSDMHSHLNGLSPEMEYTPLIQDDDPTLGGFSRIAGFIGQEKQKLDDRLLVLDAGDFSMGTFFQMIEPEHGFQLGLMKKMGYDYVALGNHEFDLGTNGLAQIIKLAKSKAPIPVLLNSNYRPKSDGRDSALAQLFSDGTILPYVLIEKNGYRIGIFSVLGIDAQESIPHSWDVKFHNAMKTARKTAKYLRKKEKADLVIALSHSGVEKNKKGEWVGEDVEMARKVSNIDLIISGHMHPHLVVPHTVGGVTIVKTEAAGSHVGRIEITFDTKRKPVFHCEMVRMDDRIVADKAIQDLIDEKARLIEHDFFSKYDAKYDQPILETNFTVAMTEKAPEESNLGPLVADALYDYLNKHLPDRVDVAFIAAGVIRNNFEKGNFGKQNMNDVFNVVPLGMGGDSIPGTPLGRLYVNNHELKTIVELILAVYHSKPHYYLYFSGMSLVVEPENRIFKKIVEMRILQPDGSEQLIPIEKNEEKLYCVAANEYMLGFIAGLKKMSKGIVNVVPKDKDGKLIAGSDLIIDLDQERDGIQEAKEWMALLEFVRRFPDTNNNGIPEIPEKYRDNEIRSRYK
jgi:5'-nucleotidase